MTCPQCCARCPLPAKFCGQCGASLNSKPPEAIRPAVELKPPKPTHPIDLEEDSDIELPSPGQYPPQTPRRESSQDSGDDGEEEAEDEAMQLAQNRSHGRRMLQEAQDVEGINEYRYESVEVNYDAEYLNALVLGTDRTRLVTQMETSYGLKCSVRMTV
jgi:hypothetical protein